MRKPDFFLVGAPKCGTTAMYEFLAQHPEIFVPATKEIHFFNTDMYSPNYGRDLQTYLSLFAMAGNEKRVGEASVWYLYSKRASAEIKQFSPGAKAVIMLRNPVEMIYSLHSQRLYVGTEDLDDFAEALNAEEYRKRGERLPANPFPIEGLFYREVGKYCAQVQRYFETLGRENVKVLIYDDFRADPLGACQDVFAFLEVNPAFEPGIRVINPNKKVRSKWLRDRLYDHPPSILRKLARPVTTPGLRHELYLAIKKMNTRYVARPPLSRKLRLELNEYFASDIEQLGELLGRSLAQWHQSSS